MGRTLHGVLLGALAGALLVGTGCVEFAMQLADDFPTELEWGRSATASLDGDASVSGLTWTVGGDQGALTIVDDVGFVIDDPDGESVIVRADQIGEGTLSVTVETTDQGTGELSATVTISEPSDPEVTLDVAGEWELHWECDGGFDGIAHYTISETGDPSELLLQTDDPWMPATVSLPAIGWDVVEYDVTYVKSGGCERAVFQFVSCDGFCKRSAYYEFEAGTCTGYGIRAGSGDPAPACPDLPLLPTPDC